MACVPTATATRFATRVSSVPSTALEDETTTAPAVVSTLTVTTLQCVSVAADDDGGATSSCASVGVPVVSTIDAGGPATVQVPILTFVGVTHTVPTETLFAPCSSTPADPSPNPPPSDPPPAPLPPPAPSPDPPVSPSPTPPPSPSPSPSPDKPSDDAATQVATSSTSLPGYVTTFTTTSTMLVSSTDGTGPFTTLPPTDDSSSGAPSSRGLIAPIVGGILGGFFGLIGIVVLIWFCWRRRAALFALDRSRTPSPLPASPSFPASFPHTPKRPRMRPSPSPSSRSDFEPKPYRYGAVGSASARTRRHSSSLYSPSPSLDLRARAPTAQTPAHSQPSTRPPTPGYFPSPTPTPNANAGVSAYGPHGSPPPSAFGMRTSWPLMGSDADDGTGAAVGTGSPTQMRSRRPSRLSGWETVTEGGGEARSSRSMSFYGEFAWPVAEHEEPAGRGERTNHERCASPGEGDEDGRRASGEEPQMRERRQSTLFVVNADAPSSTSLDAVPA